VNVMFCSDNGKSPRRNIYDSPVIYEEYEHRADVHWNSNNSYDFKLANIQYSDQGYYICFEEDIPRSNASSVRVIPYSEYERTS